MKIIAESFLGENSQMRAFQYAESLMTEKVCMTGSFGVSGGVRDLTDRRLAVL